MKNEIIIYQPNELASHIEVRVDEDTVWLSLNQIAQLFERDKSVISRHLRNVYKEGELSMEATVAKNATVQIEAGREVKREIEYLILMPSFPSGKKDILHSLKFLYEQKYYQTANSA
ncbi:MAG TPA: hypothetical protein PKY63_03285 [Bacteroidales bacterium]|jgi:hypothetical protein|nr:hypothetical protein [Bacteroidales bacterium]